MTLQDKLDEFRSKFENGQLPFKATPEQFDVMKRATKELIDSGLAKRALKVGDTAPDFALKDADGNVVRLEELLARYVVGTDRVIAYAEVSPDYTRRLDPSVLLPVLDRLRKEQGR